MLILCPSLISPLFSPDPIFCPNAPPSSFWQLVFPAFSSSLPSLMPIHRNTHRNPPVAGLWLADRQSWVLLPTIFFLRRRCFGCRPELLFRGGRSYSTALSVCQSLLYPHTTLSQRGTMTWNLRALLLHNQHHTNVMNCSLTEPEPAHIKAKNSPRAEL